jgi:hypothetical protein
MRGSLLMNNSGFVDACFRRHIEPFGRMADFIETYQAPGSVSTDCLWIWENKSDSIYSFVNSDEAWFYLENDVQL